MKGASAAGGAGRSVLPPSPVLPLTQCPPETLGALQADAGKDLQRVVGQKPDPTSRLEDTTPSTPDRTKQPPCYIDRLPTELLCRIFMLCGDPYPRFGFPGDVHMHVGHSIIDFYACTTVLISRVCSRWSTVTRGYPLLWTMVDLASPRAFDLVVLRLCLMYSVGLPMTLRLHSGLGYCASLSEARHREILRRFLHIVVNASERWAELSIHIDDQYDTLRTLLARPQNAYSSLRRVSVDNRAPGRASTVRELYQKFYASESLDGVAFWDSLAPPYLTLHDAPLQRLTRISVRYMRDPQSLFSHLYSCQGLEVLDLSAQLPSGVKRNEAYVLRRPLELPQLKILSLAGRLDWTQFLAHLMAPRLDRLDMRWYIDKVIIDMLDRSAAHLRMLTVFEPPMDLPEFFLRSPAMQYLQILRYDPGIGSEGPVDITPFVPSGVRCFTEDYDDAENAYHEFSTS
ncbi:uncharacterized protein SCHCODRAFT_02673611 [Schizophyllum commune H4-8]|nr:uncharacterized protein SCHCODRAFT_02673611 [Schizophyllum commune H4-8]KAI5885427.1 hypothetical protein SCHCODRAFT_02673611 [Schizophyllum commune H4-8]